MKPASHWLADLEYPELWEAIDEALVATAARHREIQPLAQAWLRVPKRSRAYLHGQIRLALRRRMPSL